MSEQRVTLGFSPCPNDTFIFYPLLNNLVDTGNFRFIERLEDVETLNMLAAGAVLDMTKLSYHAFAHVRNEYALLRSGSALGRGCGPLLVAAGDMDISTLHKKTIAIPGRHTTAFLLLRLFNPDIEKFIILPFNEIMDSVINGDVDAGVIIHESRFTYQGYGLKKLIDLGEWWEGETGLPIPLGGIAVRRSLGAGTIALLEKALRDGVGYSVANPDAAAHYIREHAQEMSEDICRAHINLYVNDFSSDLGDEGVKAIELLIRMAEQRGIVPESEKKLFL